MKKSILILIAVMALSLLFVSCQQQQPEQPQPEATGTSPVESPAETPVEPAETKTPDPDEPFFTMKYNYLENAYNELFLMQKNFEILEESKDTVPAENRIQFLEDLNALRGEINKNSELFNKLEDAQIDTFDDLKAENKETLDEYREEYKRLKSMVSDEAREKLETEDEFERNEIQNNQIIQLYLRRIGSYRKAYDYFLTQERRVSNEDMEQFQALMKQGTEQMKVAEQAFEDMKGKELSQEQQLKIMNEQLDKLKETFNKIDIIVKGD